jgi:hypothetical protein
MNWFQFILWLTGIYTIYYLVVILFDLQGTLRHQAGAALSNELTFDEPVIAQQAFNEVPESDEPPETSSAGVNRKGKQGATPESVGIGGVPYNEVFALARAEAIQYTGKVAF